jgi:hypothetical protein
MLLLPSAEFRKNHPLVFGKLTLKGGYFLHVLASIPARLFAERALLDQDDPEVTRKLLRNDPGPPDPCRFVRAVVPRLFFHGKIVGWS